MRASYLLFFFLFCASHSSTTVAGSGRCSPFFGDVIFIVSTTLWPAHVSVCDPAEVKGGERERSRIAVNGGRRNEAEGGGDAGRVWYNQISARLSLSVCVRVCGTFFFGPPSCAPPAPSLTSFSPFAL